MAIISLQVSKLKAVKIKKKHNGKFIKYNTQKLSVTQSGDQEKNFLFSIDLWLSHTK